jgi:hypothetical protein
VETHAKRENGESVAFPLDKFINPIGWTVLFVLYRLSIFSLLNVKKNRCSKESRLAIAKL